MEDREFASCYQKLISHYRLTPEKDERQLAEILCRIRGPNREAYAQIEEMGEPCSGGTKYENRTNGRDA